MRVGKPLQTEPEGECCPGAGRGLWGGGSHTTPHPWRGGVLQAELIITFEAIGITLDTREVVVWLDLST